MTGDSKMHQAEMPAHLDRKHRHGQHQRNPEPPRHVDQFGIGVPGRAKPAPARAPCRRSDKFPDRPAGPPDPSDRCRSCRAAAGSGRFGSGQLLFGLLWLEKTFGIGLKAFAAARAAKQILLALYSNRCLAVARLTFMPQTGSIATSASGSAVPPCLPLQQDAAGLA